MRDVFHVTHNRSADKWDVKRGGSDFALASLNLKKDATNTAVSMAKNSPLGQVKIHGLDGKIQNEWTYGKDPRRYIS